MTKWSRAKILREIRQMHRQGQDLSYAAIERTARGLQHGAEREFGSWSGAVQTAGIDYSSIRHGRQWSKQAVLQALRKRKKQGQSLLRRQVAHEDYNLLQAADKYWGSYAQALHAIGVRDAMTRRYRNWTKATCLTALKAVHRQGRDLNYRALRNRRPQLLNACKRWFGSYSAALQAAGFDYDQIRRHRTWSPQGLLALIRVEHRAGRDLSYASMRQRLGITNTCTQYFGSYRQAVQAAGIDYTTIRRRRSWTKPSVVQELQDLQKRGQDLSTMALLRHSASLYRAAGFYFGSYTKALHAVGIDPAKFRRFTTWSKPLIIETLQDLDRRGRDLRKSAMDDHSSKVYDAARNHFGTYEKALRAAGLDYPPKKPLTFWTRVKVLKTLQRLYAECVDLRYDRVKQTHQALFAAAKYYYGKYHGAVAAAGINYREMLAAGRQREAVLRQHKPKGRRG
jgi:hypothetical protein